MAVAAACWRAPSDAWHACHSGDSLGREGWRPGDQPGYSDGTAVWVRKWSDFDTQTQYVLESSVLLISLCPAGQ